MDLVIASLGVFWVLRIVEALIDAPKWFWIIASTLLGIGAGALLYGLDRWYFGFAVAGAVVFLQRSDDYLLARGDEIVANLTRRKR